MKKHIILILIVLLCVATTVFAIPPVVPGLGTNVTLRDAITANDTLDTINSDTLTLGGFSKVKLIVDFLESGTSFDITPACKDGTEWYSGDTSTITTNSWLTVDATGCTTFSVWIDNESGTSQITIKAQPYSDQ